ncbi:MAG: YchF family ATPase [Desulfobacterales bacterium]|nr:YchF family ATPase [Desulfobacterales bacterium]
MKLGIIGLPVSGKKTVFEALTHGFAHTGDKSEDRLGTIHVPDERIDALSRMYQPKKTIYAQVEYFLPGKTGQKSPGDKAETAWTAVRDMDALIHVVRNFRMFGLEAPAPEADFLKLDQELILSDLAIVERRLERMEAEGKKGKPVDTDERELLERSRRLLESEKPLRNDPDLASAPQLRGYAFLSAKPVLVLFNNEDEDTELPEIKNGLSREECLVIRGKLEHELAQMTDEEAAELLTEFDIAASAADRVIQKSYTILGLISFFTVGEDEVRAWTIQNGTVAVEAAGVIHTDMKKGFIRAETISYEDLMAAGSMNAAKKKGTLRLEGKTYPVKDGDIINFRFNV